VSTSELAVTRDALALLSAHALGVSGVVPFRRLAVRATGDALGVGGLGSKRGGRQGRPALPSSLGRSSAVAIRSMVDRRAWRVRSWREQREAELVRAALSRLGRRQAGRLYAVATIV
jgi:hypothetical protein